MENPIKIRWFGGKPPDFRKHPYRKKKNRWGLVARTPLVLRSPSRGKNGRRPVPRGDFWRREVTRKNAILWGSWLKIYLGNPQWCQLFVASDPRAVDDFFVEKVKVLVKIFLDTSFCCGNRWKHVSGQTLCTMTTDVQEENTNQRLNYAWCSLLVHPNTSIFRLHNQGSEDTFPMAVKGCGLHAMSQNAITTVDYSSTLAPWYISTLDHAWIYVVYEVDICINIIM